MKETIKSVICPISFPEQRFCDEKCEKCETYIEFVKGFERKKYGRIN